MTKRFPVSTEENTFFDAQQVTAEDLLTEQSHFDQGVSALIGNHIGSGVLAGALAQPILLDTSLVVGQLDGKPIIPTAQPSDSALGCQLEINLQGSNVYGKRKIKFCIIGLDLNGNLQYETFEFRKNESLITAKHYTKVLSFLFNDALGAAGLSFNLLGSGSLIVKEAAPFSMSRDAVMISQDQQPNLFFRDFFLDTAYLTLGSLLTAACPGYNTDALNISVAPKQLRSIAVNDVTTQIGQKFQALTNNIQKVTLLLSVQNNSISDANQWTGELVASIYSLQSTVACSSDVTPALAIDFDPSNIPLAQVSVNLSTLAAQGITLDGYSQPVDFLFSNTPIANGTLQVGSFYAVTLKRSGSADKCNIQLATQVSSQTNTRETIFNGTTWVDIPEESLWFRCLTDAAKVSDGQAYDAGLGVVLEKTAQDPATGATIDNQLRHLSFSTTQPYYGIVKAVQEQTAIVQDQRTGNPVASRKQTVPEVDLILGSKLTSLKATTEPVQLGLIQDRNIKAVNLSTATTAYQFHHFGFFKNEIVVKINDTNGDPNNNVALVTALLSGDMVEAKIITDTAVSSTFYRVVSAKLNTFIYGDVNGDGQVDNKDLSAAQALLGQTLVTSPTSAQYITSTNPFVHELTASYQVVNPSGPTTIITGTCIVTPSTSDPSIMTLTANNVIDFTTVSNILSYNLVITSALNNANLGSFQITSVIDAIHLTVKKFYRDSNAIESILRADLNGTFAVDSSDIGYISNFVQKAAPFPAPTAPGSLVGTTFRALRLKVEQFIDRGDDYPNTISSRSDNLHPVKDIALLDTALLNRNYSSSPVTFSITKQLTWLASLIIVSGRARQVISNFSYPVSLPSPPPVTSQQYPVVTQPDPGRNDTYIPNNLVLGNQLVNPDGTPYKIDFEIGNVVFQIPTKDFTTDASINLLSDIVSDYTGTGFTRLGYRAMRFADGTIVSGQALNQNQVRFAVSTQSYYSDINGTSTDGYTGVIVDVKEGVYLDYTTGILSLNFSHLINDSVNVNTLCTKIQITVYLKKAGFNNGMVFIDSAKLQNILGL